MRLPILLCSTLFVVALVAPARAQDPAETDVPVSGAILVFLDCNGPSCDFSHFRREITFVNWVRQPQDADMHLLITSQRTGGGGTAYTLDYIGRRGLAGMRDTLRYTSNGTDTNVERRDGLTQTIALGLVRFAATTTIAPRIQISFEAPQEVSQASADDDPWNLWVFNMNANGFMGGESLQRFFSIGGSASANRTSEVFKINMRFGGRISQDEFDFVDETTGADSTIVNTQRNWNASVLMVWSLGEHWSIGGTSNGSHSTFNNRNLAISGGPAIEFNVFPYSQSTRKAITFLYSLEAAAFRYELVTVAGKTNEVRPRHSLEISAVIQQPWGSVFGGIDGIQYLHDPKVHRLEFDAGISIRLFRGFNFNVGGNFARIKDQFFLPAEGLSPEEVLLRRRARETDFEYGVNIGFRFQFGSKFANIVNPRF